MINERTNSKLDKLAKFYDMPKKYVISNLVDEKLEALEKKNREVAIR